jgi:hypothetical protein
LARLNEIEISLIVAVVTCEPMEMSRLSLTKTDTPEV